MFLLKYKVPFYLQLLMKNGIFTVQICPITESQTNKKMRCCSQDPHGGHGAVPTALQHRPASEHLNTTSGSGLPVSRVQTNQSSSSLWRYKEHQLLQTVCTCLSLPQGSSWDANPLCSVCVQDHSRAHRYSLGVGWFYTKHSDKREAETDLFSMWIKLPRHSNLQWNCFLVPLFYLV